MTHTMSAPRSSYSTIPTGVLVAVVTMGACTTNQPPSSAPPSSAAQEAQPRYGATMIQPSDRGSGRAVTATRSASARVPVSDAELATLDDAHLAGLIEEVNDGASRFASVGERRVTDRQGKRFAHDLAARHVARGAESLRDSLLEGTTNRRPDAYDPDKFQR